METLSNFGERSLSKLPSYEVVPDPFRVIKVPQDVRGRTAKGRRENILIPGTSWGFTLI